MFKKIPPKFTVVSYCDYPHFIDVLQVVKTDSVVTQISSKKRISDIYLVSGNEFSLDAQLKAGVPLKEVKSQVLDASFSDDFVENLFVDDVEELASNID